MLGLNKGESKIGDLLAQGVVNKKSKFHTPTLSTINGNEINSRTIILRKVDNKTKMLFFYSDSRSRKVLNIKQNNKIINEGIFLGINDDGSLNLKMDNNKKTKYEYGEISIEGIY